MTHFKQSRKNGFTLIELLVVLGIIMLLAAILFPVFQKARERAYTASCLSNVKQLCMAIMMYTQDYDGRLPHYGDPGKITPQGTEYLQDSSYAKYGWAGAPTLGPAITGGGYGNNWATTDDALWSRPRAVNSYIKDTGVLMCPEWGGKRFRWSRGLNGPHSSAKKAMGNSYAINTRLIFPDGWLDGRNQGSDKGYGYKPGAQHSVSLAGIEWPDATGLIASAGLPGGSGPVGLFFHGGADSAWKGLGSTIAKQVGFVTVGFVDGHVKVMRTNACKRANYAYYDGGLISWWDDRYKNPNWTPFTTEKLSHHSWCE